MRILVFVMLVFLVSASNVTCLDTVHALKHKLTNKSALLLFSPMNWVKFCDLVGRPFFFP